MFRTQHYRINRFFRVISGSKNLNSALPQNIVENQSEVGHGRETGTQRNFNKCLKRKHDHIGIKTKYIWFTDDSLQEVSSYKHGLRINYSDLVRRYQLKNEKGLFHFFSHSHYMVPTNFFSGAMVIANSQLHSAKPELLKHLDYFKIGLNLVY